jgi:hypothetical protein
MRRPFVDDLRISNALDVDIVGCGKSYITAADVRQTSVCR